jgi:hypothetical protein
MHGIEVSEVSEVLWALGGSNPASLVLNYDKKHNTNKAREREREPRFASVPHPDYGPYY